jgi:hypothetical protein
MMNLAEWSQAFAVVAGISNGTQTFRDAEELGSNGKQGFKDFHLGKA